MAKIKAPLFSLDATGTLDKNITYKGLKQNHIAQKYSQPGAKNPFESSPRQKDQRSIIRLVTIHWQCMSAGDKLAWENAAKDARFKGTGYHYFLSKAQQNLTQYLGLVGYWSMNYNVDDKIPDLSGNGNHGILSPIYPCDCPTLVDSFDKIQGKAAKSNGSTAYISTPILLGPKGTIEILFKFGSDPPTAIMSWGGSDDFWNYGFSLRIKPDKYSYFGWKINNVQFSCNFYFPTSLDWTHLVLTWDTATENTIAYINGIQRSLVSGLVSVYNMVQPIYFLARNAYGSASYVSDFTEDDVLVYNYALSPLEILKHYQSYNLP